MWHGRVRGSRFAYRKELLWNHWVESRRWSGVVVDHGALELLVPLLILILLGVGEFHDEWREVTAPARRIVRKITMSHSHSQTMKTADSYSDFRRYNCNKLMLHQLINSTLTKFTLLT